MKIGYRVVMTCSDLMEDGKDISFEIPVPVPFKTPQEAEAHQSDFSAHMERMEGEVVIKLYQRGKLVPEPIETIHWELIETIHWKNWNLYQCTITRDSSIGKAVIDPIEDEEPCAMIFDEILPLLTEKDCFSLQYLAYEVEPFRLYRE